MTFVLVLLFIFMLIVPVFGTKIIELFKFVDLNSNVTDNVSMIITFLARTNYLAYNVFLY